MDDNEPRESRQSDYRMARIAVAGGMAFVLGVLLVIEAIKPDYEIQATTLGVVVTMIVVLLGIEGASILRGSK